MTPRIQNAQGMLALVILALVMVATFPPHLPSNYRLGCLATAIALWKILRLSREQTK